jgi:hypothetical protein
MREGSYGITKFTKLTEFGRRFCAENGREPKREYGVADFRIFDGINGLDGMKRFNPCRWLFFSGDTQGSSFLATLGYIIGTPLGLLMRE